MAILQIFLCLTWPERCLDVAVAAVVRLLKSIPERCEGKIIYRLFMQSNYIDAPKPGCDGKGGGNRNRIVELSGSSKDSRVSQHRKRFGTGGVILRVIKEVGGGDEYIASGMVSIG